VLKGIDRSQRDLVDLLEQDVLDPSLGLPQRSGNVQTRERRALLSLVLERASDRLNRGRANVGARVDELPVLASRLADHARVAEVLVHVQRDALPQTLEDVRAAGEVQAREVTVRDDALDEGDGLGAVGTREELDDVPGETSLEEDLEDDPGGVGSGGRRLPEHDVSDQCGDGDEVASDRGEAERVELTRLRTNGQKNVLEGCNGEDESLEWAVLDTVPNARSVLRRLHSVDLLDLLSSKAEKVGQLPDKTSVSEGDVRRSRKDAPRRRRQSRLATRFCPVRAW
jgi:hypothetical protein